MGFIGRQPTPVPLTSSDIGTDVINNTHIADTAISGFDALTSAPADTDEFLISDNGVLKRIDASLVGGGLDNWSENSGNLLPSNASYGIYLGVNSATASNLLDDYEEGSWTPVLSGVSSHSTQVGRYVKIGNTVTAHAHVNGVITGSGSITISGLPFSSNSTTNMQQSMSLGFSSYTKFTSASMLAMTVRIAPDATEFGLLRYRHNNNGDGVQRGDQDGDAVTLLIGGTYITD